MWLACQRPATRRDSDGSAPLPILLVGHLLAEPHGPALPGLLDCDIAHRLVRGRAVPVPPPRRAPDDIAGADLHNRLSLERAFLLTPSTEHAEEQQKRFVAAAVNAGVRHIVKLSQFAAASASPVRFLRYHAAVEEVVKASGLDWTFLRPNLFMQGLLQFAGMIRDKQMFTAPIGDARVSVVDVRDNAAVAAAALTQEGHAGRTYTLTGPEALSHAEMAERLSAATGCAIRFVDASDDDLRHAMAGVGMPEWQIEGLIEDYAHYARGEASVIKEGVRQATGRPARDFGGFARDYAGAFGKPDDTRG